jgi:hypothetical protein
MSKKGFLTIPAAVFAFGVLLSPTAFARHYDGGWGDRYDNRYHRGWDHRYGGHNRYVYNNYYGGGRYCDGPYRRPYYRSYARDYYYGDQPWFFYR